MAIGADAGDLGAGISKFILGASGASAAAANTKLATSGVKPNATLIGPEAAIKGDLKSKGDLVIAGTVEGEVSSDSKVVIAQGGSVIGRVTGMEIVIEGRITGDATASKSLSILSSAEVRGDVITPVIMIEPGATFIGRCSMSEGGVAAQNNS
jgi:cytoskeletal protein CcmA (bactofilin family)